MMAFAFSLGNCILLQKSDGAINKCNLCPSALLTWAMRIGFAVWRAGNCFLDSCDDLAGNYVLDSGCDVDLDDEPVQ